jgi:hypothetical protein
LTLNKDTNTAWAFIKKTGYVSVSTNNLSTTEMLGVTSVRFDLPFAYPTTGYSKIANDGSLLAATAILGSGAKEWACTRDNVTGKMWELKTDDGGLRDKDSKYSWYDPNPNTNGGFVGYQNQNPSSCTGGISYDTDGYVKAVKAQSLCGHSDWRMPTKDELLTLVKTGYTPTIELSYFPNTLSSLFWSSSPYAYSGYAWIVGFYGGDGSFDYKYGNYFVRLVRGGQ